MVPHHIALVAFGQEVVASCPSGCMDQVVEMGRVVVHLGDCLAYTCSYYCTPVEPEERLGGIGQSVHQLRIALVLWNEPARCGPELEQLALVAY